ncbi:aminotransferase class V-fold PLP-dependent enzyme [Catenovulum maritimum]|uniref:Aminotransferase class V domain-containing protein n=1 Tax=Catenovulum maritimum TaxID=1513271 RepID=A0A0J8GUD1_9ALTE|nr:aminotransferase class V-fold PLP-dependent enzyme [Catenovulum maritimum]KMT64298.1 hypothetical protein XM47_14980 [Catenovulum maritimum]
MQSGKALLNQISQAFYGADIKYQTITGKSIKRIYLDSAASCLMLKPAFLASTQYLPHYANTHSEIHNSAIVSNQMYDWAKQTVLAFVKADPKQYSCVFIGSGATGGINRCAQIMANIRPNKTTALVSLMEHHSNDLPHRKYNKKVEHIECEDSGINLGSVCIKDLEQKLIKHQGQVNYVAITGASNVTGILNPIKKISEISHQHNALVIVDGSQMLAHAPISLTRSQNDPTSADIDALVFSGHKMYAPGSPGVLIIKTKLLEQSQPNQMGGGIVSQVSKGHFDLIDDLQAREEAGTPNIFGAVNLAMSLNVLNRITMTEIAHHESELLKYLFTELSKIDGLSIYANQDLAKYPRTATFSFNLAGIDHALLAAILNDYFNIAVRNECFCAHPYVRELIIDQLWELDPDLPSEQIEAKKGMVRASFGLNNTITDAIELVNALTQIVQNPTKYTAEYELTQSQGYQHKTKQTDWRSLFCPDQMLNQLLSQQTDPQHS